ncbi:hypothetical protein OAD85_02850 [Actinomycetota bacterium]|nr:hypothetical protein [Actinomycetota bacterium]
MSAAPQLDSPHIESSSSVTEYATKRVRRNTRENLRLVAPLRVSKASRGLFVIVLTSILGVGLFGMLLINTTLAQGAFTVSELRWTHTQLIRTEATLTETVAALTGPTVLEASARELGMVPSPTPAFIKIPSGKVLGKARPAPGARIAKPVELTAAGLVQLPSSAKLPVAFDESVDLATPDLQGVTGEWSDPRLVNTPDQAKGLTLDAIAVE